MGLAITVSRRTFILYTSVASTYRVVYISMILIVTWLFCCVEVVDFGDRQTALSFVSLLDGYYRLQENYHHHLCKDVESPMVNELRMLRCHGPVRLQLSALSSALGRSALCCSL